jgi:sorting nexin-41/42
MWNDEDNNPYGSFDRRDSNSDTAAPASPPTEPSSYSYHQSTHAEAPGEVVGTERASTPTSSLDSTSNEPPDFTSNQREASDDEEDDHYKKTSQTVNYQSRIEQILYQNPDMPILITDAGKNGDSGGNYIVYTIKTGVCLERYPATQTKVDSS